MVTVEGMSDAQPARIDTALVLGGGGPVGIAWMAGLVTGLRDAGIDLSLADRFVGTSAGAVVGAVLAAGGDPAILAAPLPSDGERFEVDQELMMGIFAELAAPGSDRGTAWRRAGERALAAPVGDPAVHVARMRNLVGMDEWPDRDLRMTSIDITTGEFRVWTAADAATLPEALAASTCVPGVFPPIPVQGHHYVDGGLRSSVNADLAAGAELVAILEPLAHMFPRTPADRELGGATEISVVPDPETIALFGLDVFSTAAVAPAHEAGLRQAQDAALRLKAHWPGR
jgi:NTE family protein